MCKIDISTKRRKLSVLCVCECAALLGRKLQTRKMHYLFISSFLIFIFGCRVCEVLIVIALKWFYTNVLGIIFTHLMPSIHKRWYLMHSSHHLFFTWIAGWMKPKSVMLKLNIILNSFGIALEYTSSVCVCWFIVDRLLELLCCGF